MKTFTFTCAMLLLSCFGLFAQSGMTIQSGGQVTVNGNLNITTTPFNCGQVLTDVRDGKTYNTVQIGTQCWMQQNLNYGTRIDGVNNQSNNGIAEKYCYDNLESNCNIYGGLYQWDEAKQYSTIEGAKGICPIGWHLPTDAEWTTLTTFLGGIGIAGGKMKEAGTTYWSAPNTGATNSSGFTALPGGQRNYENGVFLNLNYDTYFWSSSQYDAIYSWARDLYYDYQHITQIYSHAKADGFSIRCLKD